MGTVLAEDAVGIFHANHLVVLDEVDRFNAEPEEALIDLLRGRDLRATVDLRHQKCFLAMAVLEGFAHPQFAEAIVIIPAVVEEVHPRIEGRADDLDPVGILFRSADVVTADPDARDEFAGLAELAEAHPVADDFLRRVESRQHIALLGGRCSGRICK